MPRSIAVAAPLTVVATATLALACACTPPPSRPSAPAPSTAPPPAIGDGAPRQTARSEPSAAAIRPVVPALARIDDARCPLSWTELDPPDQIALQPWPPASGELPDDCPPFDAAQLLAPGGCVAPDCAVGEMAPGRRVAFTMQGPDGSGHFAQSAIVTDEPTPRFACAWSSTVAWRHLYRVAHLLAPLPWFADLDGDGRFELVTWQRLPWGDAEISNGMVPIAYTLDGDALVRDPAVTRALDARVAGAYHALVAQAPMAAAQGEVESAPPGCYEVMAEVLERWAAGP